MTRLHDIPNDSALPQLASALDAEAMRARFQNALFGEVAAAACRRVRACAIEHVRYKPGKSCTVAYRLDIAEPHSTRGTMQRFGTRIFADGASASRYEKAQARQLAAPRYGPPLLHFEDLALVAWAFPNDRKLHGLPKLIEAQTPPNEMLASVIAKHFNAAWEIGGTSSRLVHYVPEHTCTMRADLQLRHRQTRAVRNLTLFGKTYFEGEGEEAYRNMQQLWESREVRMAQPLAYIAEHKILWQMGLPGATLLETNMNEPHFFELLPAAAANVAALHRAPLACSRTITREAIHAKLLEVEALIARVRPECANALALVVRRLLQQSERFIEHAPVTLHGDLHLKNFFVHGRTVSLIDLDNLCRGPAALDLGSFIAALYYRSLVTGLPAQVVKNIVRVFMEAYRAHAVTQISLAELNWHTAAALIGERVFRGVTRMKSGRTDLTDNLIARARELV